jgi:hypothetical protein
MLLMCQFSPKLAIWAPLIGAIGLFAVCSRNKDSHRDFVTSSGDSPTTVDAERQGHRILLECHRAYAALESYVGIITADSVTTFDDGPFHRGFTLKVNFQRPNKIRLEGILRHDAGKVVILSDGNITRSYGLGDDGPRASVADTMREWSGVTDSASLTLPSILLDIQWKRENFSLPYGSLLTAFATNAVLAGEEKIDNRPVYRVVCARDIGTWTFYVDKESLLIRVVQADTSPEQMRVHRSLGGGGYSGRIRSMRCVQTFDVERVNVKLEDTIFDRP